MTNIDSELHYDTHHSVTLWRQTIFGVYLYLQSKRETVTDIHSDRMTKHIMEVNNVWRVPIFAVKKRNSYRQVHSDRMTMRHCGRHKM